jgi:alpha-galactosidase
VGRYLAGALGVEPSQFAYTAVGTNHLTWFIEARVRGQDAMPQLREIASQKLTRLASALTNGQPSIEELQPFSWHLLQIFGAFPAVLDRHVTEFFPQFFAQGQYYGKTLGVDVYSVEATIAHGDKIYAEMREVATSPEPLPADYFERIGGEHEQVVEIIDSIRHNAGRIYSVNLPNRGQVPNLPAEAIVESPAVADAGGIKPITQKPLPAGIVGTLATRLAWVETIVEAALEGSRDKFVQALVLDGAVSSLEMAESLADELLSAQAQYLPQFKRPGQG